MICASSAYICSSHTCIHMLITMVPRDKPRTSTDIDRAVSAEIPDKETNPELHRIVTSHMIHGPCGHWNLDSPCMVDRKCSKDYPKQLRQDTSFSDNSYPLYRRRAEDGSPISKMIRGGINVSCQSCLGCAIQSIHPSPIQCTH